MKNLGCVYSAFIDYIYIKATKAQKVASQCGKHNIGHKKIEDLIGATKENTIEVYVKTKELSLGAIHCFVGDSWLNWAVTIFPTI